VRADSYVEEALRWLPGEEELTSTPAAVLGSLRGGEIEKPDRRIGEERQLILLADDNADMRKYLTRLLGERYRVHAVSNGEQALAALSELGPDLVLTDVMMPGIGGFEILNSPAGKSLHAGHAGDFAVGARGRRIAGRRFASGGGRLPGETVYRAGAAGPGGSAPDNGAHPPRRSGA